MKNLHYAFWLFVLAITYGCGQPSTNKSGQELASKPQPLPVVSPIYQQTAYFIAGVPQHDSCFFSTLEAKPYWQEHAAEMEKLWNRAVELRLSAMKKWCEEELSPKINDTLPLYYPFSGPDFLHAWYFYPKAPAYHMVALEPVGLFPNWEKMTDAQVKSYLANLRTSLRDVIGKSYFITSHMVTDLTSGNFSGVLPLYYVFLVRTGHSILNTQTIRLDDAGKQVADSVNCCGIRLSVTPDGYKEKIITYMKYDISDTYLAKHPEYVRWVDSMGTKNVFVKAASYLMHYNEFDMVRQTITTNMASLFQDDTGIPLHFMDTTACALKLYGEYTRPIKDFPAATFQKDLQKLYSITPKEKIGIIPFTLGYHIVGDKIQNHQLLVRR